ncbi:MAG: type 1 glutamine amidotransferase [Phycisphaerales bacterium]|nr:type 1 glutamine amidotransferase [Phycisphaerales bacterium]
MHRAPLIGITSDLIERSPGRWSVASNIAYAEKVAQAGGVPVVLAPIPDATEQHIARCDGIVLTGGDDPDMRQWGIENHPRATLMHPQRQRYETALIDLLRRSFPEKPVLGICLGMQLMCLDAGGQLDQHLPDSVATADQHRNADHRIIPRSADAACPAWLLMGGSAASNHHQGVRDPGPGMTVLATSDDGVIEAVRDDRRRFYVGVQWHPERTADERLGLDVFKALIKAATVR